MHATSKQAAKGVILYAMVVALGVKLAVDALPDAAVAFGFMRPAARLAAIYLGAVFDPSAMAISARGVTIMVVRACSATDFFSMAFTLLCFAMPIRHLALKIPAAVAAAWIVAVLANAVRLVLLADSRRPHGHRHRSLLARVRAVVVYFCRKSQLQKIF